MEAKYLSDGRKVAIVGKLNNQETIVQEIFVSAEGDEIPSGERFVVKSLHDKPVVSWLEEHNKKIEERTARLKSDEKKANNEYKKAYQELGAIKDVVRTSTRLVELLPEADLDILSSFLTGTIEYLVVSGYGINAPVKMIDEIIYWENCYGERKYDFIKLISVMGKSEGQLGYGIHRYNCSSAEYTEVHPFTRLEDALDHIKNKAEGLIDKERLTQDDFKKCIDMGIKFPRDYLDKYKKYIHQGRQTNIDYAEAEILKQKNIIKARKKEQKEINSI